MGKIECSVEIWFTLPLCVLLAWQECAGLKHKPLHHPPGYLPPCVPLSWNKGGRKRCKGLRTGLWLQRWQQGGARRVWRHDVFPPGPALLWLFCAIFWFICDHRCDCLSSVVSNVSVPVKEHTWQTVNKEVPWSEGEQTESSTGEHCAGSARAGKEDRALDWGTGLEKNLNFGSGSSNRSSLLIYQGKKASRYISGVRMVLQKLYFRQPPLYEAHQNFIHQLWCPFPWQQIGVCPVQEGLSLFGLRGCIPGIYTEPNDCNYIIWSW